MYPTDVAESEPEAVVAKSANATTIVAAITDWVVEAICGLFYSGGCGRAPAAAGPRGRANTGNARVLWKAMPQANEPVMIR